MGIQFFGEFLIDRWVITRGQLLEALELQEYRNSRFGNIAVRQGFLSEEQAEQINLKQRSTDKRFGDLAVEMGLLTQEQVRVVLTQQKNSYLYLGESLLELGHVTEDILDRELAIFEEEQARYALDDVPVPEGVLGRDGVAACVDLTRKLFLRLSNIVAKAGEPVFPEPLTDEERRRDEFHLTVSVTLMSVEPIEYLLSVSSEVAVTIASRMLGEDATRESEEMVADAVKEFCNIVCGNVAAALARKGITAEIGPPQTKAGRPQLIEDRKVVRYPLRMSLGAAEVNLLTPLASVPS